MTSSSVFPLRLDPTTHHLLRQLALQKGMSANALVAQLVRAEIDGAMPGARDAYERRNEIAEQVLHRRGIDPGSPTYQAAARDARSLLDTADRMTSERTA